MIDIHSHILPAVDDGSVSMEQTRNMLHIAFKEGIKTIIATPHYGTGCVNPSKTELEEKLVKVRREASKINKDFHIELGNEIFYSEDIIEDLRKNKALTLAGTRYVLVEFETEVTYQTLKTGLHRLLIYGYRPILAHMERYVCLYHNYEGILDLIRLGVYMQMNASSIAGSDKGKKIKFCRQLLGYEMIHMIATDSHSDYVRVPAIKEGYSYIKRRYGEFAERIFFSNQDKLLQDQYI